MDAAIQIELSYLFVSSFSLFLSVFTVEPAPIMIWCHICYTISVILYICSGYVTASEYYVSAAPNGVPCNFTDIPCHNLSYYTADYESYFTDDTIFYFLEGTHTLQSTLKINNVSNITLQGLGHIEQGFHETVMQHTSVLRCSNYNRAGIQFTSSTDVVLRSLTIANCGGSYNITYKQTNISLLFVGTHNITLDWVSIQNGSGDGLVLYNAFDVLIVNSTFTNNGGTKTFVGNTRIFSDDQLDRVSRVNIVKSNFTLGSGYGFSLSYVGANKAEIFIENSRFSHSTYGGGVFIYLYNESGSIEFSNCTIHNNMAWLYGGVIVYLQNGSSSIKFDNCTIYNNIGLIEGGGAQINLYEGSGSIEFSSCTIYNNTALLYGGGGGVYIDMYNVRGSIKFDNCTIYNNIALTDAGGVVNNLNYGNGSIEFSSCTIYNNTAQQYGGGVVIQLYNGSGSIEFNNCTIYSNTAQMYGGGVYIDLYNGNGSIEFDNCTIYNNTSQFYGGGAYIDLKYGNGSIDFGNCAIYNNTAQIFGGGAYINLYNGNSSIEFDNCTIYGNTAQIYGGGIYIRLYKRSGSTAFDNCTIYNNTAWQYGGGVFINLSNGSGSIEFSSCTIYNNIAYYGSGLCLFAFQDTSTINLLFTNVLFHYNKIPKKLVKYQSAVLIINIENVKFDQIEVSNHNTTGLLSFNSWLTFDKNNTFVNNSGIYGGGIALYDSSRLVLKEHCNVSFVNNHASESGGGIFVLQSFDLTTETDCSFNVIPYYVYCDNKTVLYFVNNTADISGNVLYGGKISNCLDFDFDCTFDYPQQTGLSAVSSDPIQVCFCESDKQNCSITNINITSIPGIDVTISLATVGIKDGLTKGMIKLTTDNSSNDIVQYDNNRLNATCTNVTFVLRANPSLNTTQVYVTLESSISEPSSDPLVKVFEVTIESCPIGFPLIKDTCVCRSELSSPSITCDINTQIITRDGDMWIGYKNDSDCLIVYPHCPFDYCNDGTIQIKINSPDPQCLLNRSGILCGQCSEGLSLMLGSNQCGQCTNNYIVLIILFALAGIVLVTFLIALNLTVSVGTINGLIFYANVVKIYEPIFFPNGHVKLFSQFISWINLDLSIETCFIDGMDSCSKTWLQFIFPGYVWFLLILIIILSQYSSKVVRLVGSHAVPVLATMILLSYTKLIRTVFQALYFVNIQCNGNNNVTLLRWYIDANVQYVGGYCHLPLFFFSLAVLILLIVPYTFYLLTIPLFEGPLSKYMCCCQKLLTYMKPFFDAYGGPYKDKCRFWTGFLLLVRIVLALVVSLDTESTIILDVLASILFVILSMHFLLKGIYWHLPLACLEMSFFLNLMFMAYVNVQTCEKSKSSRVLSVALVSVSFVVFCGIILYHVWDRLSKSCLKSPIAKIMMIFKKPPPALSTDDTEVPLMCPGSPSFI